MASCYAKYYTVPMPALSHDLVRNGKADSGEHQKLDALTTACPPLAAVREHVRGFAVMMLRLRGHDLDHWTDAVQADDLPNPHSFVAGLRRDYDTARAGLTLPHSSGKVEEHVNRVIIWNQRCQAVCL